MVDLTAETVAGREFPGAFRGYDRTQVRHFLSEVAEAIRRMELEQARLRDHLDALTGADLEADIDAASEQIRGLLQQARQIAEDMRTRAAEETSSLLEATRLQVEGDRAAAAEDAFSLRRDAWETATELIEQSMAYAAEAERSAERDAVQIVGEAEREAHRIQVASKRESEEMLRGARREAEEVLAEAKSRHDDILDTAFRQSEAAQERIRALEQRRTQLITELDAIRRGMSEPDDPESTTAEVTPNTPSEPPAPPPIVPSEPPAPAAAAPPAVDDATPSPVAEHAETSTARPSDREQDPTWSPGETVRVVRPSSTPIPPDPAPEPIIEPDIRVISADELARRRTGDTGETPALSTADPSPEVEPVNEANQPAPEPTPQVSHAADEPPEEEAGTDSTEELRSFGEPSSVAAEPGPPAVDEQTHPPSDEGGDTEEASDPDAAVLSEVAGLFDRLRTDGADVDETVEPTSGREPAPDRTDAAHSDGPMRIVDLEVFELRDRVLLPVTNQGLRSVKRRLMDHQNSALEELRIDADGWAPPEDVIGDDLRPELEAIAHDSLAAGHEAAEALVGVELPPLETTPTIPVDAFVGPLVAALNQTLTDGRESGEGDRQLSAAVSRVFRVWRTDQAERRVRRLSLEWYHRGLVAGMEAAGHESLSWRVAGRGCATCREHGSERAASAVPPAHADCECTLAPLVAVR